MVIPDVLEGPLMPEKFSRWEPVDDLQTDEDIAAYFAICVEEDPGDGPRESRHRKYI